MKILADRKIKLLFCGAAGAITLFTLVSAVVIGLKVENAAIYIVSGSLLMGISILSMGWGYFRDQNKIMEHATEQITDYISGNHNARILCDEEGVLYRLFHEVNSLVSILNAHVENEGERKQFLKEAISDISHQLKTPLAALNVYNGIVQEEAQELPVIREFTELSEQELDRIGILVHNLLKITKLDAGTMVMEKNMENVSEIMDCIRGRFAYRAGQEGKKLYLEGDQAVTLFCDRDWMIEALGNIVKNALDHTKRGDWVSVTWKLFGSFLQIIIKDNGSGIHPEDLYHIFKRFYRSRFSKDTRGLGLGLPLAKSMIEAHNGTIEVDSELGFGTTFTITLLIPTKL